MVEENVAFKFSFKPINIKPRSVGLEYSVFTDSRWSMDTFLKQHNFNALTSNVEVMEYEEFDADGVDALKPYVFRSNKTNERFVVISTERFVTDAINTTCSLLSEASLFNDVMFRGEIELVDTITDLINSLPFGAVVNHALLADHEDNFITDNWDRYTKSMKLRTDGWEHPVGDDYIYEMMFDVYGECVSTMKPQPITIEAYIRSFRETLTDEY